MTIQIITDSASDLCSGPLITVLPLTTMFGNEEYLDGVTLSPQSFYEKLVESDVLPTTSQLAPFAFAQAYEKVVAQGDIAIVITLSSKLSGTYRSAVIAAEEFAGKIFVVDSENVTIGEQILILYAKQLIEQGLPITEIVDMLNRKKKEICLIALLDTLEYLKRGGRISAAAALAGGVLSIKPVIAIENGEVAILGKARGSRHGNNMLTKMIQEKGGVDFSLPLLLGYTGLSDALLQKYIADSEALWKGKTSLPQGITIGSTIGTHAGPGAIAVAFFHC